MKSYPTTRALFLLCFSLLLSFQAKSQSTVQEVLFDQPPKERQDLKKGVTWQYYHFDSLFDAKQSVNVITIDLRKAKLIANVVYLDTSLQTTSSFAKAQDALVAINGSFFDTKKGGSVVFLQEDEALIDTTSLSNEYQFNGAVAIDERGQLQILKRPEPAWKVNEEYEDILSSGPLLIFDDQILLQDSSKFNQNRHPRSSIGITPDYQLVLVAVDGRSAQAAGMSIPELTQLMDALDCQEALNLDGGGSTTLWTQQQGIVNYPTDNKKYDHLGERAVANCIIFQE